MILNELQQNWQDTEEYHKHINDLFTDLVNKEEQLREHRDWVQNNVFGFGEKSFWWLWKLICEELPELPTMCEVGVLKGATLSVWRLLRPDASILGITPLNTAGGVWDDDYSECIARIHKYFKQKEPVIFPGYSQDSESIEFAKEYAGQDKYDVVYLDGDHTYDGVLADLKNYAPMVKHGGFLVMDDCCCDMRMPFGYFQGIQPVQDAFDAYMAERGSEWEFVFNVVHLRVMRRK